MSFDKRGLVGVKNRKGLSEVVTVGLIILLSIAAVVIVWSFVRPTLTDVGEQISGECLTVNVKPVGTCVQATGAVSVQNGPGDTTVNGVKLIYYDANGASQVVDGGCSNLEPLETADCTPAVEDAPTNTPISVAVAAVIGGTSDARTCPESPERVDCLTQ